MIEIEPRIVSPRGHGVGRREKKYFGVGKIVQRVENDQEASHSISRSPRKRGFNSRVFTS